MNAEGLRTLALSLPEAVEKETWGEATFRVRDKIFLMLAPDGKSGSFKCSSEEQEALVRSDPKTFEVAPYVGRYGWVKFRTSRVKTDEMRELVTEAWRMTAPKRLSNAFDA